MEKIISTLCGEIKGIVKDNVVSYKGIRYASASRFEYPTQVTKWDGIYDASSYKHCSYHPSVA